MAGWRRDPLHLSPSAAPPAPPPERPPRERSAAARAPRRGSSSGACALWRPPHARALPPRPAAAELCQVCEELARTGRAHGEPPPPPARDSEPAPRPGRAGLLRAARMAEPLRRTLGRLRERRGAGPGTLELCADTAAAASLSEGPGMERPALGSGVRSERPGARVPWSRGAQPEAAALGRAPARAIPGPEGSGDDDGEDEGADYYENLPAGCAPEGAEALRASPSPAAGSSPGVEGGRLETGRLQTQLREAYYLLIQAMHDLPPDSGTRRGGPAGARAPAQQPPLPHGAAVRLACGPRGDDRPPQQVSPPRSPPKESRLGRQLSPRMRLSGCRSLESLRASPQPPLLQRWASDSWISCGAHRDRDEPPPRGGGMDGWSPGSHRAAASAALLPSICQDPGRSSGRPFRDLAGTSVIASSQEERPEGPPLLKPPAVTVKKLQKWMYKGRLLSLGMKGRARGTAPKVPGAQATSPNLGTWKVHENHVLSVTTDQRITLTGR